MSVFDLTIYILKFFVPALFSVLFRAFGLGYKSKRSLIIGLVVFTSYVAVVPAFLIMTVGYGLFTHLSTLVMTIAGMSVLIFSTDSPSKTIFMQLVQGNVTTAVSVLLNMVRHILGLPYWMLVLMLVVVCPIVYYVSLRFLAKPLRFIADNIHSNMFAMLVSPVVTMVIVYLIPIYPMQNYSNHPVFCTVLMLLVQFGFFIYLYTLYQNLREISNLLKQEFKWKALETEIDSYKDYVQMAKQSRHDLRHHNALISEYLETGNIQGAINYLQEDNKNNISWTLKSYCENPVANAILRIYDRRAQSAEVAFSAFAKIPEQLPLSAPDFGGLLSNILENALISCRTSQDKNKHIVFSSFAEDGSLLLEVRNTVSDKVAFLDGMPQSQKPGGGTGTRSILATVKKYKGFVNFTQKGNEFYSRVVLPL